MRARGLMARALLRRAKVSVRDRLRLPDGLRAFAQGSYKVSLRWRGGCPCGHQFYMPPVGGENHTTGLRPMENKPTAPGAMEMHPFSREAGLPPEGEVCSKLSLCSHKHHKGKHRANLPPPGETPPQAAEGVHFHRAEGAVLLFSRRRRVYILIAAKRRYHTQPSDPKGSSNLRTLRPTARQT